MNSKVECERAGVCLSREAIIIRYVASDLSFSFHKSARKTAADRLMATP